MAQGFETDIAIKEICEGWGSNVELGPAIQITEPDSSDLNAGFQQNRRAAKVRGVRALDASLITNDFANPAGGFTSQPRNAELLPLFMSHYQLVEVVNGNISAGTASGTYRFVPFTRRPDMVGSNWGSFSSPSGVGGGYTAWQYVVQDFYPITVEMALGTLFGAAAQAQMKYSMGFVNQISWDQPFDNDLKLTFACMFQGRAADASIFSESANFGTNWEPGGLRYAGWNGTITLDGTANSILDIENFGFVTQQKADGKGRLGAYGFGKFRFNDDESVGRIRCELQDYAMYQKVVSGSRFTTSMTWWGDASHWIKLDMYNCMFRPAYPNLSSGDAPIDLDIEFECAATFVGNIGTPSHVVSLYVEFGTDYLTIQDGVGKTI